MMFLPAIGADVAQVLLANDYIDARSAAIILAIFECLITGSLVAFLRFFSPAVKRFGAAAKVIAGLYLLFVLLPLAVSVWISVAGLLDLPAAPWMTGVSVVMNGVNGTLFTLAVVQLVRSVRGL
jgi:hypothetical protein